MKQSKTRIVSVAVGVLATLSLVGCTPGTAGDSSDASFESTATSSALKTVLERGTVRVGDCLSFAPFGFKDESGEPDGYDVDIAKRLAEDLGVKLEVVDTTSANRIPNLQTDKVDVVFCNFTRNGERAREIDFTDPYVVASQALLVHKDSGISSAQDLPGKTVATVKGSTNADVLKDLGIDVKTDEYDTSQAAILAVKQGQADTMIEDSNFLAYQAKLNPALEVTSDALVPLEYNAFGVKQGDQVWVNYLNQFLFRLNASGENKSLYNKWFGVDPTYPLNPQY
ncbi:transporter substrate-binding domain-containing protein [Nocardioides sp.]|uniref:ABC transporter substrate-binding protein n=1 Tax=Nocardioides sp. TaxID=35761 RepID=UPI002621B52A|nr:transporter substrate-binding domain-containing protein [Nocardioides sp.]MDI6910356.1 transporter substrate-binding domain-containing protein [Nocardioides sp.]